jgi:hypothetical protein
MASRHTGRTLTTDLRATGEGATVRQSWYKASHRAYRQPPSAKQKAESTRKDEPKAFTAARDAVIGQADLPSYWL